MQLIIYYGDWSNAIFIYLFIINICWVHLFLILIHTLIHIAFFRLFFFPSIFWFSFFLFDIVADKII